MAINATQVEVKFNQPVSKESLFADGKSGAFNASATVTFTTLTADNVPSGTLTGKLSEERKTLTITTANPVSKRYDVLIDGLKTTTDKTVAKFQNVVTFTADKTAPAILSTTKNSVSSFTVKFSEPISTLGTVSFKLADGTSVTTNSTGVTNDFVAGTQEVTFTVGSEVVLGNAPTVDGAGSYTKDYVTTLVESADLSPTTVEYKTTTNKKVIRVELDAFLGTTFDVKGAAYTLDLAFADVKSEAKVDVEGTTAKFTRGEDGTAANTDVVGITSVVQGSDNNKVDVTFDKAVDGASATNVANYKVDGAIIESVTLKKAVKAADDTVSQVAVLNLKENSNGFSGVRNIKISNVKALGSSKVMNEYADTVDLKENVVPTVTSAKLTGTTEITLTFSEAVQQAGLTNMDFELLVGGASLPTPVKVDTGLTTTGTTTVKMTIPQVKADQISKGLSLKALPTLDVKDGEENKLSVPANITVTQ
ncbi:hypothetical protein [Pseudobacillus badius]|uniref:hypothetical protein n=1 Tax=Bacillus badius TaxID=1455 RepID=UPI0007B37AE1|nr:hypothetical protein [Bacillus badius]KZR58636.1 hypothetical protein A3781_15565 [Bacillus badius]